MRQKSSDVATILSNMIVSIARWLDETKVKWCCYNSVKHDSVNSKMVGWDKSQVFLTIPLMISFFTYDTFPSLKRRWIELNAEKFWKNIFLLFGNYKWNLVQILVAAAKVYFVVLMTLEKVYFVVLMTLEKVHFVVLMTLEKDHFVVLMT